MKIHLAGCVIIDDYDRLLLLHRSAGEVASQWELPGGKVEYGEVPESAAVRELHEELGIRVRLIRTLGHGEFADDENDYVYHWFQARITAGMLSLMEPDKFDDVDYFEIEDLMSLALSANMQLLLPKLIDGEVELDTAG